MNYIVISKLNKQKTSIITNNELYYNKKLTSIQ